jgi:hypothetical protein
MSAEPITPENVVQHKKTQIPECVIQTFNDLIALNWNGYEAVVKQEQIVEHLVSVHKVDRNIIFLQHYLDIEDIYRKAGWVVEYDKPAYNESYDAYFTFSKKKL